MSARVKRLALTRLAKRAAKLRADVVEAHLALNMPAETVRALLALDTAEDMLLEVRDHQTIPPRQLGSVKLGTYFLKQNEKDPNAFDVISYQPSDK